MSDHEIISYGPCPCCQSGQVGFRQCADKETVVLLCEECAFVWMHPVRFSAAQAQDPLDADFKRKNPACVLQPSRWADRAEIETFGWGAYLLKPGDIAVP